MAALTWFKKAACCYDDAMRQLAFMYYRGFGTPQDYKAAFKWNRAAASLGHSGAQVALAVAYFNGQGTLQDYIYAHMWANIAAANDPDAITFRNDMEKRLVPHQLAEAQRLAMECVQKNYKNC